MIDASRSRKLTQADMYKRADLMKNVDCVYIIPDLEKVPYTQWSARKKALREYYLGKDPE